MTRIFFVVIALVSIVCALIAVTIYVVPPEHLERLNRLDIRQHLAALIFMQLSIFTMLLWWLFFLPSVAHWYLTCARTFLMIFVASSAASLSGVLPDVLQIIYSSSADDLFSANFKYSKSAFSLLGLAVTSGYFTGRFSSKYELYR